MLGEAAVRVQSGERTVFTVHVFPSAARRAYSVGDQGEHDDSVARLDAGDRAADVSDPAGVLVPQGVREVRVLDLPPDPLDHVKRPAEAGPTSANDHVVRTPDLRAGDVVQLEVFVVVALESSSLHSLQHAGADAPARIDRETRRLRTPGRPHRGLDLATPDGSLGSDCGPRLNQVRQRRCREIRERRMDGRSVEGHVGGGSLTVSHGPSNSARLRYAPGCQTPSQGETVLTTSGPAGGPGGTRPGWDWTRASTGGGTAFCFEAAQASCSRVPQINRMTPHQCP